MKFVFTDKKVNLPNKVHAYAEKKVGKLDRYFKADAEAAIVFSVEKGRNNVELTIRSGGTIIRVAESTSDMFATIDAAVSSVERRLRRNKTRLEKRLRQDAFTRSVDAEEISSFAPETDEEEYKIVRSKKFPIKPMTVDEAVLQMELVGHTFFAFKDVDQDGRFSVVYKRNDGDYGLIEDET
ncbi:ribosome hibernation-promoting factor, HPF/YfiA family [Intestinimonas massiliensis (ex Afouda et al. 2020)]|uniref:ribosome hibernation-promoting factor, HPF/YfiA family n=1 Tax=Intestinimonas massiliensis (ex Afouda et al. 2020) TaxID=1673721 RepID=UPI00102FBAD0|nr:ribosome-associated translation inhibitor RaiA [Intestinimonas massiliensis (ex Afouda et al. 2020)]